MSFFGSSVSKTKSTCNVGHPDSIPGLGRSSGGGNGNPLQYSRLGNLKVREAWWATVHGVTKIGHYLATKPPPLYIYIDTHTHTHIYIYIMREKF